MRLLAAFAMSSCLLLAQAGREPLRVVSSVRHWSLSDATRVAVQVSGDFNFRFARLHNPERVYFDILNARPQFQARPSYLEFLQDRLVTRIRVSANAPDVTRVVLDLADGTEVSPSRLVNPDRLIIEVRAAAAQPAPVLQPAPAQTAVPSTAPPTASAPAPARPAPPKLSVGAQPAPAGPGSSPLAGVVRPAPPKLSVGPPIEVPSSIQVPAYAPLENSTVEPPRPQLATREPLPGAKAPRTVSAPPPAAPPATPAELAKAARRTSAGGSSLVRALGLKVARVVIDPGHGGHDQGTEGPHGLLEKDLVLDLAKRLGALIEERMGSEVVYTRSDDTFIPLQARTALANDKRADLFLSIHANSSPVPAVAGIETFFLNVTGSKYAMDVASRENASSQQSVFELADLVQRIARTDKAEESKEFAERIQASLYTFSARNIPGSKDRGIKSAPFVVLIGAHMPSVLAEIGFLSNPKEETLLKKPDYRQKLAEAIYRGVSRYADSLSHFQTPPPPPAATVAAKRQAQADLPAR